MLINGRVDKEQIFLQFTGDPGNFLTAVSDWSGSDVSDRMDDIWNCIQEDVIALPSDDTPLAFSVDIPPEYYDDIFLVAIEELFQSIYPLVSEHSIEAHLHPVSHNVYALTVSGCFRDPFEDTPSYAEQSSNIEVDDQNCFLVKDPCSWKIEIS